MCQFQTQWCPEPAHTHNPRMSQPKISHSTAFLQPLNFCVSTIDQVVRLGLRLNDVQFWLSEVSYGTNSNCDFFLIWMCSWLKPPHHSGFRVPFNSAFQVSSPRNGLNHESWGSPKAEFPTNSGLQFSFWTKKHILEYSSICFFLQTQDYISLFGERNIHWNIPVYAIPRSLWQSLKLP